MKSGPLLAAALVASFAVASTGCDKVKSMAGGAGGSLFGGDFEGEITMAASSKSKPASAGPTTLVFGIKKPKLRIDATGNTGSNNPMLGSEGASVIIDPPQKKGWALMPAQKKAIVLDFEKMKGMSAAMKPGVTKTGGGGTGAGAPPPTIEKTGKKDTVAGYACEIWKVTQNDGRRAEICVAEGITWMDLSDLGWSNPEITVAAALGSANHFPLRIVSYDAKGTEDTRLEATKIDKKKLDDAHFVVPPDYQVIDLSQMLGNLGNLGQMGAPPSGMPSGMPAGIPSGFVMPSLPKKR